MILMQPEVASTGKRSEHVPGGEPHIIDVFQFFPCVAGLRPLESPPALAVGCPGVVKPVATSGSVLTLAELTRGLRPDGVFNMPRIRCRPCPDPPALVSRTSAGTCHLTEARSAASRGSGLDGAVNSPATGLVGHDTDPSCADRIAVLRDAPGADVHG